MDVDLKKNEVLLTAYYLESPQELELELLDDIVTNSNAHIPNLFVESQIKLTKNHIQNEQHDFTIFATYDEI